MCDGSDLRVVRCLRSWSSGDGGGDARERLLRGRLHERIKETMRTAHWARFATGSAAHFRSLTLRRRRQTKSHHSQSALESEREEDH